MEKKKYAAWKLLALGVILISCPNVAFGVVQCFCRGQFTDMPDGTNCRDWCLGPQRPSYTPVPQPSSPAPQYNSGQQQQLQQQQLQKQRDEEQAKQIAEEKKRQEEFEKSKKSALKLLKGTDSSEFGLKGFDQGAPSGLKGAADTGLKDINADSSVVDLRHLEANKPITVDPNIPKGKQRKFAVQVSDKTLNNENYIKGFEAIKSGNHTLAVQYFKKAQAELPNDVLVQNGLGLAQDLERVHKEEAVKKTSATAGSLGWKGFQAMIAGDYDAAIAHYESAAKVNPRYRDDVTFVRGMQLGRTIGTEEASSADQKALREKSGKVIDSAFVAWQKRDYDTSILLLQTALTLDPYNQKIQDNIDFVKEVQKKNPYSQSKKRKLKKIN